MSVRKEQFISSIKDNQQIKDLFLIKDMRLAETKAGKPYLSLQIMDNSGELDGRVWDNAENMALVCQPGKIVLISAQSQQYKGVVQLKVMDAQEVEHIADLGDFLPATPGDIEQMSQELIGYVEAVKDKNIKKLLKAFIADKETWDAFKKAPAAKVMHHAYIGGLLEHTLSICRLVKKTADLYPSINKSLVMAGAFLHDFGKIKEFSFETLPFDYSDQGRLIGHMVITLELIQEKISKISNFPEETATLIKHLVLSHHGRHEFGSPSLPMVREAFVLNFLDDFDAKMNYLDRLAAKNDKSEYQWTEYQRGLERFLFVPGNSSMQIEEEEPRRVKADNSSSNSQPTLWG